MSTLRFWFITEASILTYRENQLNKINSSGYILHSLLWLIKIYFDKNLKLIRKRGLFLLAYRKTLQYGKLNSYGRLYSRLLQCYNGERDTMWPQLLSQSKERFKVWTSGNLSKDISREVDQWNVQNTLSYSCVCKFFSLIRTSVFPNWLPWNWGSYPPTETEHFL